MKFGQNLPRNQVPEWAPSYIDYKILKKSIKSAKQTAERDDEAADLAGTYTHTINHKAHQFHRRLLLTLLA